MNYDYVIIGGGTAGLVVSSRLAQRGEKVLVLESGGDPLHDSNIESASNFVLNVGTVNDYAYDVQDASLPMPRGRCLGGSSAINFLLWNRPNRREIESWRALGVQGWSWDTVLENICKAETFLPPSSCQISDFGLPEKQDIHLYGTKGPIAISHPSYASCTDRRWLETMSHAHVPVNGSPHDGDNAGANVSPVTVDKEHRRTYARNYLELERQGMLDIRTHSTVKRIDTERTQNGIRGVSVECVSEEEQYTIDIGKEVVLAAGAIATPAILEKSGIGDERVLRERGIEPLLNLPGVGSYQGHYYVTVCCELRDVDAATMDTLRWDSEARAAEERKTDGTPSILHQAAGCVAYLTPDDILSTEEKATLSELLSDLESGGAEQRVVAQLYRDASVPQVELDMVGFFADASGTQPVDGKQYVTFMVGCQHPVSRGRVHVREDAVEVVSNYNAHPIDKLILKAGIRFVRSVVTKSEPLSGIIEKEVSPGDGISDEQYMQNAPAYPACTAKMGNVLSSVVDSQLRVHGCKNVTVADASVMPTQVSAHIQSLVYAIAERAACLI